MPEIKKYYLHKNDPSKLHFQIHEAASYCKHNIEHCYKAHQHSFYQLIWFEAAGIHYVDYEFMEHEANTLFFLNKGQIHYFSQEALNQGFLFHFDEIFLNQQDLNADNWLQYNLFNELGLPYVVLSTEEAKEFSYFIGLLQKELKGEAHNYQAQVFHLFRILLLKVERLKQKEQTIYVCFLISTNKIKIYEKEIFGRFNNRRRFDRINASVFVEEKKHKSNHS